MKPAPVQFERETEAYLRRTLAATRQGMDAALVWSPMQEVNDPVSGVGRRFDHPAVMLAWYKKGERSQDTFFELFGFAVSITPGTLEHIEKKTITRVALDTGFPKGPAQWHILKVD